VPDLAVPRRRGVGTIGLVDIDVVSPSNLQRQILFGVSNVGEDKVKAAAKRLRDVNPDCNVVEHKTIVNASNVLDLIKDYDVVIDGTDNFPPATRRTAERYHPSLRL
jgi:adenylyltransferase/sulfurtransferase